MPPRTLNSAVSRMKRGCRRRPVVRDLVGHRLVESAPVAERPEVQLQRLQLDAQLVRHVFESRVAKSGWPVFGHRQVNSGSVMRIV